MILHMSKGTWCFYAPLQNCVLKVIIPADHVGLIIGSEEATSIHKVQNAK